MQTVTTKKYRWASLRLLEQIVTLLLYFAFAKLGLHMATLNDVASPVWPATGAAIALIYFLGPRVSLAIWLAAFFANSSTSLSWDLNLLVASGNTLEAIVGAYLFRHLGRIWKGEAPFYADVFRYSAVAVVSSSLSATFGSVALLLSKVVTPDGFTASWITWWTGDVLGCLFIFPLIYEVHRRFLVDNSQTDSKMSMRAFGRFLFAVSGIAAISWFIFMGSDGAPYLFAIFFALMLAVQLSSYIGPYCAALFMSSISIIVTFKGGGPFRSSDVNNSLIHLQFFLASLWLSAIVLNSLKRANLLRRAYWVFICGWLLTGFAFYGFYESALRIDRREFELKALEASHHVRVTMQSYIQLLEAGTAYVMANKKMDESSWKSFVDGLKFKQRYAGLKGIGIIYAVKDGEVQDFVLSKRRERKDFAVHDLAYDGVFRRDSPYKYIITYIEPRAENLPAPGLHISSELNRYSAAIRARDTGEAALTQAIQLVQSEKQAGMGYLLFVPFYSPADNRSGSSNLKDRLRGFVYAPLEGTAFFSSATSSFTRSLQLVGLESTRTAPQSFPDGRDIYAATIDLAGVKFKLTWKNLNPMGSFGITAASLAGFSGAFATLVFAMLVAGLEGLSLAARRIADKMTSEVRERERLWRVLTETSPVGVFLTNAAHEVTYINSRFHAITGLSLEEIKKGELRSMIATEDRDRVYHHWRHFLQKGLDSYEETYRLHLHNETRYVSTQAVPIRADEGEIVGYMGTLQDLSDLHRNQTALAAATRLSSLGQMAGGIAHEINTPLAVIGGKADLLLKLLDSPEFDRAVAQSHVQKITNTVHKIAKIIKGLRTISRDPSAEEPVIFGLNEVISETIEICEKRFQTHGIRLMRTGILPLQTNVWGRPVQLGQVLLNLLNNAFDAVKNCPEKWVELRCTVFGKTVKIEVIDSGAKVSEEIQERLFHPFFTTKKVGEGTGLGLSISRSIIERSGGKLYFDQKPKNTTFVIELRGADDNER